MSDPQAEPLVDALRRVRVFDGLDDAQRQWLAERMEEAHFEVGHTLFEVGAVADRMIAMLSGELQVVVSGTNEPFLFVHEGDVSGLLPYSRMTVLRATARATRPSRVAFLHKRHFPDLLRELPSVAERLVWMMADRIREFAVHETHREKLMALGKLSAGLAHELNNPASAVQRAAAQLCTLLTELQAHAAGAAASSLAERLMVTDTPGDPLDRSDRERGLRQWSKSAGLDVPRDALTALADAGLDANEVTQLVAGIPQSEVASLLVRITMAWRARSLVDDIEKATTRIADLVGAIKEYAYRDQAPTQTVDVRSSLDRTLTVFTPRLKHGVTVERDYQEDLPSIQANAGELTQMWTNLIDNALDAMQESGTLRVRAARDNETLVVQIGDSGPGIPKEIQRQVFEPFFTTKPQGEGTGLGLDIVRGIAQRHQGAVRVLHSEPGDTVMQVRLPIGSVANEENASGDHVPAS
ncbi:Globin-coupled histidine kinase [Luteitalea pratensis]|uniref:histidine kinase n=1 Tax=Luteitalea pratensis TaxID=1855912 RepID=A0A143PFD4_LUTPR|nr:ATP-binding protein [Luteitalea pratensis]AMY07225.1 Globin-coupled histidine kinase [Luteitalea pratensis]